jgi:hypothetical protein
MKFYIKTIQLINMCNATLFLFLIFLIFCAMPPKRALSLKQQILLSQIENIRKHHLTPMPLTKALHHTATRLKKQGLA